MGVDNSYGSGVANTGLASNRQRRQMSAAEKARAAGLRAGTIGRPAGSSPFNNLKGGAISWESIGALGADIALAGIGYAGSRVGVSRTAARSANMARPMTTAERSAAVTRAGRSGVGRIGPSIKPREPFFHQALIEEGGDYPGIASEPFSSYETAYHRASEIYRRKYGKPSPDSLTPVSNMTEMNRYRGHTESVLVDGPHELGGPFNMVERTYQEMVPLAIKQTLDRRAQQGPLRKTAPVRKRGR